MAAPTLMLRRFCWGAMIFIAAGHPPVSAEILDTTLTIGEGWTIVRDMRRVDLAAGEQDLVLDKIPAEADLSTLTIRTRRIPVDLLDWERVDANAGRARSLEHADALVVTGDGEVGDAAVGRSVGRDSETIRREGLPVRCRIRIPVGGTRSLEVVYRVRDVEWASYYQVFIRGEPDGLDERVALDLTGYVRIRNSTDRSFSNALVRVVGADPRLPREPEELPGFLMLSDSPLSDLWKAQEVEPPLELTYRMPRRVNIPAHTETEARFIGSLRIPATRVYVLDSREIPLSVIGSFRPLNQYLVFKNTAANGLGWVLPPGPVEVFHGVTRRTLRLPGFLPHTPIDREIRVDMGKADDVRGMRRSVRRTEPDFGYYEETFQLSLENDRPRAVRVEVYERPPVELSWDVQRASADYELEGTAIRMEPRIPGGESREIELRLRFHQPSL